MNNRIEQIIEEIEEDIESCRFQPLSTRKIIVDKEEISEYLRELKLKTPDEIKRVQNIIKNKDDILEKAQKDADDIIHQAEIRAKEMVSQSDIMQKAYAEANEAVNMANRQAQEIIDNATQDANNIRFSAITYTDDMMANIGNILNNTLADAGGKYRDFIESLQSCLDVIENNRRELAPQTAQAAAINGAYQNSSYQSSSSEPVEDMSLIDGEGDN